MSRKVFALESSRGSALNNLIQKGAAARIKRWKTIDCKTSASIALQKCYVKHEKRGVRQIMWALSDPGLCGLKWILEQDLQDCRGFSGGSAHDGGLVGGILLYRMRERIAEGKGDAPKKEGTTLSRAVELLLSRLGRSGHADWAGLAVARFLTRSFHVWPRPSEEDAARGVQTSGGILSRGWGRLVYRVLARLAMRSATSATNSSTGIPFWRAPSRRRNETVSSATSRSPTISI